MYLSRLQLNPAQAQARRDLSSAYEMHRTLTRAYAAGPDAPARRFLWRLEHGGATAAHAIVLVQADTPGDWSVLASMPDYALDVRGNKVVDLAMFVQVGRRYRFRLLANPTVTRNGKRYGLLRSIDQESWLARQSEKHGFRVLDQLVSGSDQLEARRAKGSHRITVQRVQFEGTLQAEDARVLSAALVTGIGHAKALGLGLLSLAPIAGS